VRCSACRHESPDGVRFCGECGANFEVICSACGQNTPAGGRFCDHCGEALPLDSPTISKDPDAAPGGPGSFASGRYRVERFLGEGAKKRVYLAHDTRLDRDVAIGVIKTEGLDAQGRLRVEREVHAMGRLGEHAHVVNVYDVGEDAGLLYVVSQYAAGGDLAQRLREAPDHRLPLAEVLRVADELCQALEHAHVNAIVHRDLTPSNVYLSEDGTAKLGDFGLAGRIDRSRLTQEGTMIGTVEYMPPEQALGRPPDPRNDLYGLGALLYAMTAGRPPFLGDNAATILSQHINTMPVAPSWHNPEIPKALEELILALLAKDPEERPESAARVRVILRESAEAPREPSTTKVNPLDRLESGIFVGREQELQELRAGLDDALSGNPRILMLVGEPGIGKTHTATELATYGRMRGAQMLWGRCYEGEGAPAYWPWIQIIRAYVHDCDPRTLESEMGPAAADIGEVVSEVRERLPDLPAPPALVPDDARFRLFEGIVGFLRNASARQPVVIVLDDLHWADKSSLLLLEFLMSELGRARLLVLGTYRDVGLRREHPLAATLAEFARDRRSKRILLRGLAQEDVAHFIQRASHAEPTRDLVEAVYRETEGNPFFVHEVVRLLASDGRLERAREIQSWSIEIPQGTREVVGRRLNQLSPECNGALRVAAVLGRDFDFRVLKRVADLREDTLVEVLDEVLGARLIDERDGGGYRFAHALIQQTLYDELNAPRRVRLHQRAGEVLEEIHGRRPGPQLVEIANHQFQALQAVGAERVMDSAVRAGDWECAHLAYEEAVGHYQCAVDAFELGDEPDEARLCQLLVELGRLQQLAGDQTAQLETSRRAVELARRLGATELFARAALVYSTGGFVEPWRVDETAVALLEEALERLGPENSPLRARMLDSLARHLAHSTDPEPRKRLWDEARAIATRLDDGPLLFQVSPALAIWDRKMEEWLPAVEEKVRLAHGLDASASFDALSWRATVRLLLGDMTGMQADHAAMERIATELRTPFARYTLTLRRATSETLLGQLDDAERSAHDAFQMGRRAFEQTAQQNLLYQLFVILIHRGTLRSNRKAGEIAERYADPIYRAIFTRCLAAEDSRQKTTRQFERLARRDFEGVPFGLNWTASMCLLADICAYLEDRARASLLYERMRPYATYHAVGAASGAGQYGPFGMRLGMLARILGRFPDADRHFRSTIEWAEGAGARPWLAHTRVEYARMLLARTDAADRENALGQANAALDLGRQIGMQGVVRDALSIKLELQPVHFTSIEEVANRVLERQTDFAPFAAPDGTVTLIFSDIEDYTGMLQRLGDLAAHQVVQDHNAIVREQTARHAGREVELRGDGFLLAFASARVAVRCAIELQRALAAQNAKRPDTPVKVRVGVHTGKAIEDADKFFGRSVVQASRIADLARGGEILISSATKKLVQTAGNFVFEAGRDVELKGLSGTHRVYPVCWERTAKAES
jgi:class 3 adenylate cyclase